MDDEQEKGEEEGKGEEEAEEEQKRKVKEEEGAEGEQEEQELELKIQNFGLPVSLTANIKYPGLPRKQFFVYVGAIVGVVFVVAVDD